MRHLSLLAITTILLSASCGAWLSAADVTFAPPKDIANGSVSGASCIDAGHINGDAFADVVVIEGGKHAGGRKTFAWFESPSNPQGTWIRHEINANAPLRLFLGSAKLADFDNDGDLDLAVSSDNHSGGTKAADVYVFVNPGAANVNGTWSYQRVTPSTLALHHINDMEIADIDGDGKKDIIVRSLEPNQIHIFFQNSMSSWTKRTLDTGIAQSEGLSVGQIDNDGRPDITFTGWWLKTPSDARNGNYNKNPIDSNYQNVNQNTKESTGDIDGDGLIDIVISPAEAYRNGGVQDLSWYKNPGGNYGSNWQKHVILANTNCHHTVKLADMDNDGDLDVVTGKPWSASGIPKESLLFYNDGNGNYGPKQVLVSGKGLYTGVVVDIGNDGDLDIVGQDSYAGTSKPWLYESTLAGAPPADTQAPSTPGNLTASATGSSSIALSWTASTDQVGVTAYEISRNGAVLTTVTSTSYTNTGLIAATAYSYSVRARDAAGNWSAVATATATTAVALVPNAATRIEAESFVSQHGLGIYSGGSGQKIGSIENGTWASYQLDFGSGANTAAFRGASKTNGGTIELHLGSTTGTLIGSCVVPKTGDWNAFVDLSCTVNNVSGVQTLYLVFVGGSGALLDVDYFQFSTTAASDTQAPTQPSGFVATASGATAVNVSWNASSDNVGVTGYEISRNGVVLTTVTGLNYDDSGLAAATTYTYALRARDAAGNWSASTTTTVTTAATAPMNPLGTWQIALHGSNEVLQIMGTANYADLQLQIDADLDDQIWTIQPGTSAGWYEIINTGTGKALECWAKTRAEGDEVTQYSINHYDWQQWKVTQQTDGSWRIEGKYNTRSVTAGSTNTGANVDARTDTAAATQRWDLIAPGPAAPVGNG